MLLARLCRSSGAAARLGQTDVTCLARPFEMGDQMDSSFRARRARTTDAASRAAQMTSNLNFGSES